MSISIDNGKILPKLNFSIGSKHWIGKNAEKILVSYFKLLGYGCGGMMYGDVKKSPILWKEDSNDLKWEEFSRGPSHQTVTTNSRIIENVLEYYGYDPNNHILEVQPESIKKGQGRLKVKI